jgi:ubiquinone/menaquinone biosynthesis C-methylase UbiE
MQSPRPDHLKAQVKEFWNRQSCDTQVAKAAKLSKAYFDEIEAFRYGDQPFIHSFAQFSRYHGKRVLEVGFGAGTDFIQWHRAGALVCGIDLTQEALDHLTRRIEAYRLPKPERILVGDAESLPFESNTFDLGYSFGVLHHTPDTEAGLRELVRVIRPGGELKIMLYNRRSIWAINRWVKFALLRGRPWKSLSWVMWYHNESLGTKSYTRRELARMLSALPLENIHIHTEITAGDYLASSAFRPLNLIYRTAIRLAGYHYGWQPSHYVARIDTEEPDRSTAPRSDQQDPTRPLFTGNRLGFYHCARAQKLVANPETSSSPAF